MIHVPDVRATVAWYESIGFKVVATYGDDTGDNFSFAIVSFGDSEVMFNTGGKPSEKWRREVDLYVYTDNVDELYETLKDRVDVVEGPQDKFYGMREVIIRDLNRFWITFGQENVFATLMGGIYEGDLERVRKAVESKALTADTLNIALAFASATEKRDDQIVQTLTAAGAQPPPEIPLDTLQSYAGTYRGEHSLAAEITVESGRLFVAPRGQQKMSLWPLDQVTFRPVAIADSTLIFDVEGDKAVGLTFSQGGYKMKLSRGKTDDTHESG
ncbi:MAG TPA: VOC family protein [Pyrinomonadaceae bacterium]|nr:VOC family protein [Pyrinomonadaceae bacterium]